MKLSDRVRPDVEAAPWVIEEIKKLEAELDRLDARCTDLLFEIKEIHGA